MIYTSNFDNLKNLDKKYIPIAICGRCPDNYKGLRYPKLAPKKKFFNEWLINKDNNFYIEHFNEEVLKDLNQLDVVGDLINLIDNCEEIEEEVKMWLHIVNCGVWCNPHIHIVLVCYEPKEEFCHRHRVRDWLNESITKCSEL